MGCHVLQGPFLLQLDTGSGLMVVMSRLSFWERGFTLNGSALPSFHLFGCARVDIFTDQVGTKRVCPTKEMESRWIRQG